MTPEELNTFLEAGWWVVGPYPANLAEFCPPELDPDPSVPVHVIDPQSGLSDPPKRWQSVPTGRLGRVDLTSYPGRTDSASIYALAYVSSPQEQSTLLMIQKTQALRIWINGELVEDGTPGEYPPQPHYEQFHRVPVVLRAGRNSVLIKAATADFTVRLGDTPRDRAILLAEQERFDEALAAHAAMTQADRDDLSGATPHTLRPIVALLATDDVYLEACRSRFASAPDGWAGHRFSTAHLLALRPNSLFDEHAATLTTWVDEFLTRQPGDFAFPAGALVQYRAANRERALALLDQYPHKPYGLPLRALLTHQAGDAAAAETFLQEALTVADEEAARKERDRSSFHGQWHIPWWYEWAIYLTLLREAEQEIRGETTQSDGVRERCEAVARAKWTASPETVAFDQAILFGCLDDGGPKRYPQPLLARGRRLAELGRFDEAEADYNRAVELTRDDPDVLASRGRFFAEHGQPERAAADFHAALNLFSDSGEKPRWQWGVLIDLAAAQRDDVFEQLASLRPPGGTDIWTARVCVLVRNGDLPGAQAAASHVHPNSPLHAALALLSGDRGEYDRLCTSVSEEVHPLPLTAQLGLGPTDESLTAKLAAAAERLQQDSPENDYARLWISLAQLRAGDAHQVADELEAAYSGVSLWRRAISAPILAIAHRQLGDSAAARHWLAQSERLIHLYSAESQPDVTRVFGPHTLMPYDWLYALVLHNEAKQLIDGDLENPANPSIPDGPQQAEARALIEEASESQENNP